MSREPFLSFQRLLAPVLVALVVGVSPADASTPVASPVNDIQLVPVIDEYQTEFSQALDGLPHYAMDLALDAQQSTLGGSMVVTYPNRTGEVLNYLPFRLYPNAEYYLEGESIIESVTIDGTEVTPRLDESGTVLFIDLPAPLLPGETLAVTIDFTTVVPRNADGSFGILNNDVADGRIVLADWYPVVAGRDETGWRLEPPTKQGDPTFSATSLFDLTLELPEGYAVVATGDEIVQSDGTVKIESGPVREFAMVAFQNGISLQNGVGKTLVGTVVSPQYETGGSHLLALASDALDYYNTAYGAYPFRELDFVETPLSLAYGVSWSGILFIDEGQLALPAESYPSLDFTILHEVGHQWWGGVVGANSNDHTWMVEGLTNATAVLAQAALQGQSAATNSLNAWIVGPYLNLLDNSGDGVADVSIFDQSADSPLSTLAYGKGALGFLAIRNAIGHEAFQQALTSYADSYRLGIAEPADLLAEFEMSSGQDLDALWNLWFESAGVTRADVDALVPEIIASF